MKAKMAVLLLIGVLLVACAAKTMQAAKAKNAGSFTWTVERNYEDVYRDLLEKIRDKYRLTIQADLYHDIKEGDIGISYTTQYPVYTNSTYMVVEIKGLSDARSQVTAYYVLTTWRRHAAEVGEWINGKGDDLCEEGCDEKM